MKGFFVIFIVCFLTSQATVGQIQTDLMLSLSGGLDTHLDDAGHYNGTLVTGINASLKISKKKFSPLTLHLIGGARYSTTGYRMSGTLDSRPWFYTKYYVSSYYDTNSRLLQSFFNVPIGLELRFRPEPATAPKGDVFSLIVMLNNAFLLSSQLSESVYSYQTDSRLEKTTDLKPYAGRYYPGFTVECRVMKFVHLGFTFQKISYEKAHDALDFDGKSGSPFYEMISKNGVWRDHYFYIGVNIPTTVFNRKK